MFLLNILDNIFLPYNYSNITFYLTNISGVNSYFPLLIISNILFIVKLFTLKLITSFELLLELQINTNMKDAICVAIKFLACVSLLIFARGGIPRFRFDYLTKLGWIRFLSLVILSFLLELLILSMF